MALARRPRLLATGTSVGFLLGVVLVTLALAGNVFAGNPRISYRWNHVPGSPATAGATDVMGQESLISPGKVWKTIVVHELFGDQFTPVDVGASGDSIGDYGVFQDNLADPDTGEVIGTIDVVCFSGYADMCNGTIRLAGRGQININGMTPLGVDPDHFPITGGTGRYADVGGSLKVEFPSDEYAMLTLTLTR